MRESLKEVKELGFEPAAWLRVLKKRLEEAKRNRDNQDEIFYDWFENESIEHKIFDLEENIKVFEEELENEKH